MTDVLTVADLRSRLRLPVVVAPMFLVSDPDMVIASCRAGLVGSFPTANARTPEILKAWLERITGESAAFGEFAPYAVNVVVRETTSPRFQADIALVEQFKPPIVITSVGAPGDVVRRVHAYGGLVFHDIATLRHAAKAASEGVDGLILLTAGAGGHTGQANPFAFVPQVRRSWGGAILLAGAISDGRGVAAAEALGADFAYMGTRFVATVEAGAPEAYKALLVTQAMADVVTTDRVSGMTATFLKGSIERVGLDPANLPPTAGLFRPAIPDHLMAWRDIWSGGHGVGLIDDVPTIADLVSRLEGEYCAAVG